MNIGAHIPSKNAIEEISKRKRKYLLTFSLVFLLILQACGGSGSTDTTPERIPASEDTPINPPAEPDNPPPPPTGEGNNPPPADNNPPGEKKEDIDRAIEILQTADDDVLECIANSFPTDIYQKIVSDLDPDNFEAGVVIACNDDPLSASGNTAQPPSGDSGDNNNTSPTTVPSDSGGNNNQPSESNQPSGPEGNSGNSWYDLNVYEYTPSYTAASSNGNSGFGLNESADILLSGYGFNNSGGATKLNHPVSVSANAGKLAVSDRFNNRVLIWNSIPSSDTPPDIVLGQPNFDTHNSGTGLNNMDFPGQVSITPDGKVLVADSDNNRVLVWTSFPTSSGQAANYAIPVTEYVNFGDSWPWGVWSDGTKVVVSATVAQAVLFWDTFPGPNTAPDVVLTSSQVGTPRSIISDGNYVMLGDENGNGPCPGSRTTHIWTSWPTSSRNPDACVDNWLAGTIHDSKIYGIAAGGETMYFYDDLYTSTDELKANLQTAQPNEGHRWAGGDDGGAAVADGKLFVAEYNGNRISVFNSIPTSPTEKPDWALMADKPTDYPLLDDFIIQNPIIDSNGRMLFVSSDFDRSLSIYKQLPGSSGATPDIVMRRFDQAPWDLVVEDKEVYLGGGNSVYGWTDIEATINSGNFSFNLNADRIGSVSFREVRGVAYNGTYFAVSDRGNNAVYIWEGVPSTSDEPAFTLSNLQNLGRIDMNDTHLAIGCYPEGSSLKVIALSDLATSTYQSVPGEKCPSEMSFNEKGFFMNKDDSIIGWNSIEDALSGASPTMSFGGRTDKTNIGTKMATGIGWDGKHFWVGEFKFSNRLLGFAPSK